MDRVKIKVLSLKSAISRREKFVDNFYKYSSKNFAFFDGVYGKNLTPETLNSIYSSDKAKLKIGRELTLGEIGATYSHYLIYQEAINEDLDYCIVLEDDSFISPHFDVVINSILETVTANDDAVIFIQEHSLNENVILSNKKKALVSDYFLQRMLGSSQYFVGSYGYIITRKSMRKLLTSYMPIYCVCDHWYHIKKQSKISNFYCLNPSVVKTNPEDIREVDSFINKERKKVLVKKNIGFIAKSKIIVKSKVLKILDKDWE